MGRDVLLVSKNFPMVIFQGANFISSSSINGRGVEEASACILLT